ncbi:MAG: hypothetical protein HKN87_06285 [Saprospiraceae bacterium]|nr:hypothetical protein [Saprospiraceae bacterium]
MKYLHVLVIILFVLFAYWQLNDVDPYLWVPVYLAAALCAFLFVINRPVPILPMIGLAVCVVGMVMLLPDFIRWVQGGMPTITGSMKAESPHVELVREFLGFIIAGGAYYYYMQHMRRIKKTLL